MQTFLKATISLGIILLATGIGKKLPTLAGLIAVMPLTGAIVLVWLHADSGGDPAIMQDYAKGALWGILPSILFFGMVFLGFKKNLPTAATLTAGFGIWLIAACLHQWFMR
jgi:uncharacterized membrane protein (GlpM family)